MRATDGVRKISKATRMVAGGVATVAAAAGLFVANATPAFADGYWETQTVGATGVSAWGTSSTASGRTCDIGMHITDTKSDGHRAGVQVQRYNHHNGNRTNYYRYNVAGSGTTVDRHIWNLDDSLGVDIHVREFVSEGAIESGGHLVDRGDWVVVCEG
jgi:hypothetical protein